MEFHKLEISTHSTGVTCWVNVILPLAYIFVAAEIGMYICS